MWRFPCGNMFIVQNTTKNHFLDRLSFRSKWVGETDFIGPWKYFRDHWIYNSQLFQEIQFSFALRWLYANTLKYLHTAASIHSYVTSNSERYLRYIANVSISRQRHWRKTEAYLTSGKGSLWKRWKEYFHFQSIFLHCLVGFWIYLKPGGTPWRFWWRSLEKSNLKVCSLCSKKKCPISDKIYD